MLRSDHGTGPYRRTATDLSVLTGVRSSKPTFYAEYRHTSASLDRTLRSLDRTARALVSTEQGPEALCREVVHAAGDHLGAPWVVLALRSDALPDAAVRLVARDPDGAILLTWRSLPAHVRARVQQALARPGRKGRPGRDVLVPLQLRGAVQGVLAALRDRPDPDAVRPDDTDLRVLTILANQAVMSLQSDDALRRVQQAHESLAEARRRQVVDGERRRLARELHDSVAQQVLSAGLAIERCRVDLPSTSALSAQLERARQLTRAALDQLRSSIHALSDGRTGPDEDLPGMLRRLRALRATKQFDVTVRITGRRVPLAPAAKRSLFRIASECLFNTAVHAGARRAVVSLRYGDGTLRLAVSDDGDGNPAVIRMIFRGEVPGTGRGYHRGLADIAARVEDMAGTLAVTRSRLGGVRVETEVPLALVRDPDTSPTSSPEAPGGADD